MRMSLAAPGDCLKVTGALDRFSLSDPQCYKFPAISSALTIDLESVENADTAGLAWLLKLVSHYQKTQKVEIINEPEQLIALASISNVLDLLPLRH